MPNYQKLYLTLFNKMTDIMNEIQEAQQIAEELYLQSDEPNLVMLNPHSKRRKVAVRPPSNKSRRYRV